jgi:conjugal transfer pilus assembly protein TrbC
MMRVILLMVMCLLSTFAKSADDTQSFIAEAKLHEADQLRDYTQFAIEAKKYESSVAAPYKQEAKLANIQSQRLIADSQDNNIYKHEVLRPAVIIFVSFSMPDESIVAYLRDARKLHACVVIRGLINNSFKETFKKMASLVKQAGISGVELNPPLFKRFSVSHVPAVVVLPISEKQVANTLYFSDTDFDVVYGDIPLFDALKTIRDHGSVSQKKAGELLLVMQDSSHE